MEPYEPGGAGIGFGGAYSMPMTPRWGAGRRGMAGVGGRQRGPQTFGFEPWLGGGAYRGIGGYGGGDEGSGGPMLPGGRSGYGARGRAYRAGRGFGYQPSSGYEPASAFAGIGDPYADIPRYGYDAESDNAFPWTQEGYNPYPPPPGGGGGGSPGIGDSGGGTDQGGGNGGADADTTSGRGSYGSFSEMWNSPEFRSGWANVADMFSVSPTRGLGIAMGYDPIGDMARNAGIGGGWGKGGIADDLAAFGGVDPRDGGVASAGNAGAWGGTGEKVAKGGTLRRAGSSSSERPGGSPGIGAVQGDGDGRDDKIPALLSDGEHVIPADVVAAMGRGSSKAGHKALNDLILKKRAAYRKTLGKLPPPKG